MLQLKSSGLLLILSAILTLISIKASATCLAGYTWTQSADNIIAFTDASTGTTINTTYYWSFGDGNYGSTQNPVHTYNIPGTYYACLHIMDSLCSSYFCDSITVTGIIICNMTVGCYEYAHASCPTCADGEAHSFASGGMAPYSYSWNTNPVQTTQSATGLLPGAYTVCVTDANGCTACCTVTIDTFSCTLSAYCYEYVHASCPTCADGAAHSYAYGGTYPYSYVWNTNPVQTTSSATGLLPGTYIVCITDANGCTGCCTVTIDTAGCTMTAACYQYAPASCPTCADGIAHSGPYGGTAPFTYEWNTNPVQTTAAATGLLPGAYTVCITDANGCTACCTVTIDTFSCTMSAYCYEYVHASCPTCADGAAHAYAYGGTYPYSYVWNTNPVQTTSSATGLLPGTYTVCITDANGCTGCCTVTIDTAGCTMTAGCYEYAHASCPTCADGEAHSYASGGTAPYSYSWNTNPVQTTQAATGLLPGAYTVCITDANGCTACCTVTIDTFGCTMSAYCYEYVHASCPTCADGAAHSYAYGGTYPYSYVWNTNPVQTTSSATGLLPGTYTVCITDANGCTGCCSVTIDTAGCTMTVGCYEYAQASCPTCSDGIAHSYASGGTAPYSYSWNTNPVQTTQAATGLLPGAYTVCITDANGCTACCTVAVYYSNPNCSAYYYLYPDTSVAHTYWAVNMSAGVPPLTYLWSWGDGTYDSIAYPTHTYANAGYYTICLYIQDSTGCTDSICNSYQLQKLSAENTIITVNVIQNIPSTVENTNVLQSWSVFPNPAQGSAFINYTLLLPAKVSIDLYDVLGNKVYRVEKGDELTGEYNAYIDTRKLSSGIYVLQIHAGNQVATQKIAVIK